MGDIQQFAITPTGRKNIPGSIPTLTIEGIVYANDGSVLGDFTGAAALSFPAVIATLTDAEVAVLTQMVAIWLLRLKAGLGT